MPDAGERTLVCVFLRGGADTLNLIAPYGDDRYYKLRPTISIPPPTSDSDANDAAIRLDDFYAFHPKLRPLLPLFKEGRLGVVQAVGSDNASGSHFEAQDQMEHGESQGRSLGRGLARTTPAFARGQTDDAALGGGHRRNDPRIVARRAFGERDEIAR